MERKQKKQLEQLNKKIVNAEETESDAQSQTNNLEPKLATHRNGKHVPMKGDEERLHSSLTVATQNTSLALKDDVALNQLGVINHEPNSVPKPGVRKEIDLMDLFKKHEAMVASFQEKQKVSEQLGNEPFEKEMRRRLDEMEMTQEVILALVYGMMLKQDQAAEIPRERESEVIHPHQIESQIVQAFGQQNDRSNVQSEFNEVAEQSSKSQFDQMLLKVDNSLAIPE